MITIKLNRYQNSKRLIFLLECCLSNGIPVVSRSIDQEINDVIDSIFKYYIGSWMEDLLYDKEEVKFHFYSPLLFHKLFLTNV